MPIYDALTQATDYAKILQSKTMDLDMLLLHDSSLTSKTQKEQSVSPDQLSCLCLDQCGNYVY